MGRCGRAGNGLKPDGNENDGISVNFFLGSALTLSFADGSMLEVKPAETVPSFVSSYGKV